MDNHNIYLEKVESEKYAVYTSTGIYSGENYKKEWKTITNVLIIFRRK